MTKTFRLTITTPMELLLDQVPVLSLRAEDESGSFGILKGHTDFLTVLPASILRWISAAGETRYCAVGPGLLTVSGGDQVAVSCRKAILGDELDKLEAEVRELRQGEADLDRQARVEQMRLHANAVRQMMRFLRPARPGMLDHPPSVTAGGKGGE
ncbi:F0F1 ATP synthase subunit epsilon [Celeribacter neptunius]|uniref:ATP synthase epsilon chain n=1 Tax=Celeribacter neptunius TaxID=588602 RepID=A0A1I3NV30_9RHOB|nr:F0F1 ATP synthase subunit epsilon [Celeribacter neptunius]SFJ12880.1 F-type H+-transporting ATPase subunit epsilon [Celeribacter neptunius]